MSRNPPCKLLLEAWLEPYSGILLRVTRSFACAERAAADLRQEMQLQLLNSLPAFIGNANDKMHREFPLKI
jgi:DNA-directed RNA polymerase specialized sigma24 family protein